MTQLLSGEIKETGEKVFSLEVKYQGEYPPNGEFALRMFMILDWWYHAVEGTGVDPQDIIEMACRKIKADQTERESSGEEKAD